MTITQDHVKGTLNESISEELSGWAEEQERSGEVVVAERPATENDFLRAQRNNLLGRKKKTRVSFAGPEGGTGNTDVEDPLPPPPETKPNDTDKDIKSTARLLRTMSATGPRMSAKIEDTAAWESMVHELDVKMKKLDADGHFADTGSLKVPWYAPPIQRQRWGDEHTLPIVNYGTLFFDLFFVAAVYNLGGMLTSAVAVNDDNDTAADSLRAAIYFLGIFGPVFSTWESDVYYQSRYLVADYAHQFSEVVRFLCIAAVVLFIRPIRELADPQANKAMFLLMLAMSCESLMRLIFHTELYFRGHGDLETIKNHTLHDMKINIIPSTLIYFASTIIAAVFFYGPFDEPLNTGSIWNVTDLPLTLTAVGYLISVFMKIRGTFRKSHHGSDIRKTLVPYNIDFVIQRYSDWFLMLLGEVVMGMVEMKDSESNYLVALMGSLTLIVLHTLKFESEPDNPHGHALWRNTRNAYAFRVLMELMSIAMILLGVAFKILLADGRFGISERLCAYGVSGSLGWVLFTLELMLMTHKGFWRSWRRLFRRNENNPNVVIYWPLAWITLFKVALLFFLITVPTWHGRAETTIVFGFFVVVAVAATRIIGWAFVFKEDEIKVMMSSAKERLKSVGGPVSSERWSNTNRNNPVQSRLSGVDEETESNVSGDSFIRRNKDAYHGMFDAVIFSDFEGVIISVNNVAVEMFRYEAKSDLVGQNLSVLVGGGGAHHHDRYMQKFRERGGLSEAFGKQRKVKARRSDGTEFQCILGIKMAGNGKHIIGYIRDMEDFPDDISISERSLIENVDTEAKTEKQLKRVLDDQSFDCIAVIDLEGNIVGVNRTFVKEFRYDSKDEVLGLDIAIIMDSTYQAMHTKMLARYREMSEKGETISNCKVVGKQNLLPVLRKDGSEFKCIIGVHPIDDSDLLVGFIRNVETMLP
ncbi:unnamed protein product [Cylindrotheca closterium]|uniref:PAS domain-containing protein n=1 Tax=Cylindrotheca closterium TaxID=2856 RepID=A0AAD2PU99_9STRA|nr:unnamed protein product [Cylindrotheca closterium]